MPLKLSPVNWQMVRERTIRAKAFPGSPKRYQPLEPLAFRVDSPLCIALLSNSQAKYNWWLAGRCQAYAYSGAFVSRQLLGLEQWTIGLDRAIFLDFRKYTLNQNQYALEFTFPHWHTQMNIKVWKYTSPLSSVLSPEIEILRDAINVPLERIESKIDAL
ncbi:hypothetical protein LC605_30080 [Nostoc sp. CHAB 5836]|uniref:hypothetical protein n=1 Tax=Nostoc sp. CHAB 5836 TaxID=2780404 RepID=UPI001E2EDE6C|nr:hypothetical protein [Nostoc sp. CHAB 5836]MCC5619246.1 hypothetical protein [Nostoc sp. CHAB 5836]